MHVKVPYVPLRPSWFFMAYDCWRSNSSEQSSAWKWTSLDQVRDSYKDTPDKWVGSFLMLLIQLKDPKATMSAFVALTCASMAEESIIIMLSSHCSVFM